MQRMTAVALAIAIGGLWTASCGSLAQTVPPPEPPPDPPTVPASSERIVAYTWSPVTKAADRLVYAIKVDRRNHNVRQVAAQLRARPPGQRVIRLWKWAIPDLTRHPADRCRRPDGRPTEYWYPQPSAGLALVRSRWTIFLAELHRLNAPLEEVILDFEGGYGTGSLDPDQRRRQLEAIQSDPRFRGIKSADERELSDLSRAAKGFKEEDLAIWRGAMCKVVDDALQAAIYEPLREVYPNARCSNYNSACLRRDVAIPWYNGVVLWSDSDGFGTHDTISAYGELRTTLTKLRLRDGRPLGRTPYAGLLYTVKRVESVDHSSERPIKVWVAPRSQPIPKGSLLSNTPYHDEFIRHLVVRRYGLILWNGKVAHDDAQMLYLNAILNECAERIGETGPSLPHSTAWADKIVQSTAYHGDLVVHRFTLEDPRSGLRYRINGVDHVRHVGPGEVGIWVTHARGDEFHVVD